MEVFEAITQHPVFNVAIKHLVYESAKIVDCTLEDYHDALEAQVRGLEYVRCRTSNNAVRQLIAMVRPRGMEDSSTR